MGGSAGRERDGQVKESVGNAAEGEEERENCRDVVKYTCKRVLQKLNVRLDRRTKCLFPGYFLSFFLSFTPFYCP